jgi:beta-xylosidase
MNNNNNYLPKDVWSADQGDGTYINPIIHADYSDPDVIRVGGDFYMVASSFAHMPGLPILHSKDLVNWRIVNHVIQSLDLPGYDTVQHGKGVWAPSIRYHDGKFWVFFSTPDEGIFMSTAEDPRGTWSPLHMVKEVKGWIDPCPLWDEDGRAYLVYAFAHSRAGIKHLLHMAPMSADGKSLLAEGTLIFDGTIEHPTIEGPKLYKRNGYYYVFAPAGGVPTGWQTILRSRSIYGPYEDKIVLHQGNTPTNGPHQGGWVELESGESWFIHFQDKEAYGRIVHLQPVEWINDWPLMGHNRNNEGIGEPVLRWKKPNVGGQYPIQNPQTSDNFASEQLGLQWQWQANPKDSWYSLSANKSSLRLYSVSHQEESLYNAPHLLMQKFPAAAFGAATKVTLHADTNHDRAGLVVFGFQYGYTALMRNDQGDFILAQYVGKGTDDSVKEIKNAEVKVSSNTVYLRVNVEETGFCKFYYSEDGENFEAIGESFKASEARWVGAKVGIFASSIAGEMGQGFADFAYFHVDAPYSS